MIPRKKQVAGLVSVRLFGLSVSCVVGMWGEDDGERETYGTG
jgi:hypothetical protein